MLTSEEVLSPAPSVSAQTEAMLGSLGIDELPAEEKVDAPAPKTEGTLSLGSNSVTLRLSALVGSYDRQVVKDAAQLRTYVTHKLIEMSHCGDPRQELKALELLGKISEVGLFTTQTEVTVTHKTSDELADAIRERITRLLNPEEEKEKEILVDPEDELDIQDVEEYEEIEASPT
jgi:hypothetical protein